MLAVAPAPAHFDVADDEHDFYGRRYWTEYSKARGLPDIGERARSDLSERCCFWLERLLEVTGRPGAPSRSAAVTAASFGSCSELGFDATGTELSGWVVDFAQRTFDVPVLLGRLEMLRSRSPASRASPRSTCSSISDDPLETVRRCAELLAPDGVLLLQTPCYRGEGPDWSMFQEDEHIHLFTEESDRRLLLGRAGFGDVRVEPSLFPYDMWVVASRDALPAGAREPRGAVAGQWRMPAAFQGAARSLTAASRGTPGNSRRRRGRPRGAVRPGGGADTAPRRSGGGGGAAGAGRRTLGRLLRDAERDRTARLAQVRS